MAVISNSVALRPKFIVAWPGAKAPRRSFSLCLYGGPTAFDVGPAYSSSIFFVAAEIVVVLDDVSEYLAEPGFDPVTRCIGCQRRKL